MEAAVAVFAVDTACIVRKWDGMNTVDSCFVGERHFWVTATLAYVTTN